MTLSPKLSLTLAVLAGLGLAASQPSLAQTISVSNTITPGALDITQLSTDGSTGSPDGLNYYTDNNTNFGGGNPGQTFTTGSNSAGYNLSSVSVQVGSAGTGGGVGAPFTLFLDSISASGTTATQISSTSFSSPGFTGGNWATFNLPSAQLLSSNTTYAYSISNTYHGGGYTFFDNTNTIGYSGGQLAEINPNGAVTYGGSHSYDATFDLGLTNAVARQSFGLKFGADQSNSSLAATDVAGVLPQSNWNNMYGSVGTGIPLKDNSGTTITGASVTYSGTNNYHATSNTSTPDRKLMDGYLDNNNMNNTDAVTVSGIKYAKYDVYAYVGSDSSNRTGSVTIGGTTYDYRTVGDSGGSYTQTTDTSGNYPYSDYALFTGLTGSSFTLDQNIAGSNPGNSGLFGMQIVDDPSAAPEPSQLAGLCFTAFGALALILKARKRTTTTMPAA